MADHNTRYWYEPILPGENVFPASCRRTLTHFLTNVSSHLSRKRTEDTFLQFLTNSSSIIIVFLNELAAAFTAVGSGSTEAKDIVEQYLLAAPDSSLANVLSKEQQRKKLNMIADDVLSNYLDPRAYNCSPVRDFLREVFAKVVLESTVISLSRPEFINDWIIYLLQDGESEIMHAIDAGVEGARNQGVNPSRASEESKAVPTGSSVDSQATQVDIATEEAMREAKRLSAMIASQNVRSTIVDSGDLNANAALAETTNKNDIQSTAPQSSILNETVLNEEEPGIAPRQQEVPTPLIVNLHGALVMVDDSAGNEKGAIKSRPTWDYLLQVEPNSSRSTGWMVFRKYADFQTIHEMLETVARLNRIQSFSEHFPTLPSWKGKTRYDLARELERYLQEAMKHESLANTDRMRRFLEKEGGSNESDTPSKPGFSFPSQSAFENMGKGVLGALTNAPKGVAGGSKAVFDGMTGVFGGPGHNRRSTATADQLPQQMDAALKSEQRDVTSDPIPVQANNETPLVHTPRTSREESSTSSISDLDSGVSPDSAQQNAHGPPVHSNSPKSLESNSHPANVQNDEALQANSPDASQSRTNGDPESSPQNMRRQGSPITADETQIAVELIFAVINELYTLSSAWNIRRTLLNAAKTYILRPGSPTLETLRALLQDSMIESHTSDDAIGEYLKKLRENALPTEDELNAWPPPPTEEEKEQLRTKARRLFVQRGIPQALTSVMGAAASREALEKIFDSLQVDSVAQGFIFSVLLQGLRVLTL